MLGKGCLEKICRRERGQGLVLHTHKLRPSGLVQMQVLTKMKVRARAQRIGTGRLEQRKSKGVIDFSFISFSGAPLLFSPSLSLFLSSSQARKARRQLWVRGAVLPSPFGYRQL